MVRKECCRVLVDKCPENAFTNPFTKIKNDPESFYQMASICSYIKFGKHKVTLRPHWDRNKRWKNQFIIRDDVDTFSEQMLKYIE
jgi:hypothetical protein